MNIVIDTNIFISALIKDGMTRNLIISSKDSLLIPEFEFDEIEKHKKEILEKSKLSESELNNLFSNLLKYVAVIETEKIIGYRGEAFEIIGKIDKDDVIFVATVLAFNAAIWSEDSDFQKQNKIKVLTTKDIIKIKEFP